MNLSRIYRQRTLLATALGSIAGLSSGCTADSGATSWSLALVGIAAASATTAFIVHRSSKKLRLELEKHARELETSEERHRLLLAQASDAILVADADTGVIIEANQCASDLLGWN